jgi:hypothetical protein
VGANKDGFSEGFCDDWEGVNEGLMEGGFIEGDTREGLIEGSKVVSVGSSDGFNEEGCWGEGALDGALDTVG